MGGDIVRRDLPRLLAGELAPEPQDERGVTTAPLLEKRHGRIDWSQPARRVHDHVRGMSPWPGAFTQVEGKRVKVHRTHVVSEDGADATPGTILRAGADALHVACGAGVIALDELQLEGRKRLPAAQVLAGTGWRAGTRFEEGEP